MALLKLIEWDSRISGKQYYIEDVLHSIIQDHILVQDVYVPPRVSFEYRKVSQSKIAPFILQV